MSVRQCLPMPILNTSRQNSLESKDLSSPTVMEDLDLFLLQTTGFISSGLSSAKFLNIPGKYLCCCADSNRFSSLFLHLSKREFHRLLFRRCLP